MRLRKSKGQALTEFILIIPLFFIILLGVIQFSRLYMAFQMVHLASFCATRAAIVRPCTPFHPEDSSQLDFNRAVFAAAVMPLTAIAPGSSDIFNLGAYDWMPGFPTSNSTVGLDFKGVGGDVYYNKFYNAQYMTAVRRVYITGMGSPLDDPVTWQPYARDRGPASALNGGDCDLGPIDCDDPMHHAQNVPAAGCDITLEVTFLYPMMVPLVNRVVYGLFVNFTTLASDLSLARIGADDRIDDVMVYPFATRPDVGQLDMFSAIEAFIGEADSNNGLYFDGALGGSVASSYSAWLYSKKFYPIPIRARSTLTVEGGSSYL